MVTYRSLRNVSRLKDDIYTFLSLLLNPGDVFLLVLSRYLVQLAPLFDPCNPGVLRVL